MSQPNFAILIAILILAVEALVECVKWFVEPADPDPKVAKRTLIIRAASLTLGLAIFTLAKMDIFAVAGLILPGAPWTGAVITGLIAGRQGATLHDILKLIPAASTNLLKK